MPAPEGWVSGRRCAPLAHFREPPLSKMPTVRAQVVLLCDVKAGADLSPSVLLANETGPGDADLSDARANHGVWMPYQGAPLGRIPSACGALWELREPGDLYHAGCISAAQPTPISMTRCISLLSVRQALGVQTGLGLSAAGVEGAGGAQDQHAASLPTACFPR